MAQPFFWYDVMTSDTQAAAEFYAAVAGWQQRDGGPGYTIFTADGIGIAGLMEVPPDAAAMGAKPAWMGYIRVDEAAAACAAIAAEGGVVHKGPVTIENIIAFAVAADPQGAGFLIAQPLPGMPQERPVPGAPGTIGWHELMAEDWQTAWPFYETLFGWTKSAAMEMGEMGVYQIFRMGGEDAGAMMTRPPGVPVSYWNYYITVASVTAAAGTIAERGGTLLLGPMEVPGGQHILQALDPQGALFCLVSPGQ